MLVVDRVAEKLYSRAVHIRHMAREEDCRFKIDSENENYERVYWCAGYSYASDMGDMEYSVAMNMTANGPKAAIVREMECKSVSSR